MQHSALVCAATLAFLCSVSDTRAQSFTFEDSFSGAAVEPFWFKFGRDVLPDTPSVGRLALRTNVIDTYPRIESGTFVPSKFVRITLKHKMLPSTSWPNYFFPYVDFLQPGGQGFSFRWLRSAWAPDYCSLPSGFDKVVVRWRDGSCGLSPIQSSTLYGRDLTSTVEFDLEAAQIRYFIDGASSPTWTTPIPEANRRPVNKVNVVGYGWFTGHAHELDSAKVEFQASGDTVRSPLDGLTTGPDGLAWQPTLAEYANFASRSRYWAIPAKGWNHVGTDIALSYAGHLRTESDGLNTPTEAIIGKPVFAICDGVIRRNDTKVGNAFDSVLSIEHRDCGGRDVVAYYGHMFSSRANGSSVARGDNIGRVLSFTAGQSSDTGSASHLHMTVDTILDRRLETAKLVKCKFRSAPASSEAVAGDPTIDVAELWNCKELRNFDKKKPYTEAEATGLQPGTLLLSRGWGIVIVRAYKDELGNFKGIADGLLANLHIKDEAMRCQGFIPFYQLWDSAGSPALACRPPSGDPDL